MSYAARGTFIIKISGSVVIVVRIVFQGKNQGPGRGLSLIQSSVGASRSTRTHAGEAGCHEVFGWPCDVNARSFSLDPRGIYARK